MNLIPIGLGIGLGLGIVAISRTRESFGNVAIAGPKSLFLNFVNISGRDFTLVDYIHRLKISNNVTRQQTFKVNGLFERTVNQPTNPDLPLVIIVPGIGASEILSRNGNEWSSVWGSGTSVASGANGTSVASGGSNGVNKDVSIIEVVPKGNAIVNATGVQTALNKFGLLKFETNVYDQLIESLIAIGYRENETLFGANYDFRKIGSVSEIEDWCSNLTNLIRSSGRRAVIIGHDLGSVVANYFLVTSSGAFKKQYIKSFISVSGSFGGCPKAVRTIFSNNSFKNFSGLSLMLPSPSVYGVQPIMKLNELAYNSNSLINLLDDETRAIYDISNEVRNVSMQAPNVPVYLVLGDSMKTESFYKYNGSLLNRPVLERPFYRMNLPESTLYSYESKYVGDGTMPKFALEYPMNWTKAQQDPIHYEFFNSADHNKILSMKEPIKYILGNL